MENAVITITDVRLIRVTEEKELKVVVSAELNLEGKCCKVEYAKGIIAFTPAGNKEPVDLPTSVRDRVSEILDAYVAGILSRPILTFKNDYNDCCPTRCNLEE